MATLVANFSSFHYPDKRKVQLLWLGLSRRSEGLADANASVATRFALLFTAGPARNLRSTGQLPYLNAMTVTMTTTPDFLSWEYDPTTLTESTEEQDARKVAAAYEADFDRDAARLLVLMEEEMRIKAERTRLEKAFLQRFPDTPGQYLARSRVFAVEVTRGTRRVWDQEALRALSAAHAPEWIEPQFKANPDKIPAAELQATLDAYSRLERGRTSIKVRAIA